MINFKIIRYKNLLSVGKSFIEFNFVNGTKTLIIGKNGAGKSLLIDALCFALYGKAFRKIKKEQLINSINQKGLVVELEFSIGTREYKIRRGVKPNFVELYIDGKLKDQDASVNDYQAFIENSILKMTEKTFRQIVVLGSTSYIPFMRLPAYHRRIVVEDLLDLALFSDMHNVIRSRASAMKGKYQNAVSELKLIENTINLRTETLEKMSSSNEKEIINNNAAIENYLNEINELRAELGKAKEKSSEAKDRLSELRESRASVKKQIKQFHSLISKIENNKDRILKENKFYQDNDNCPTCHQEIDDDFKEVTIDVNGKKIAEIEKGLSDLNSRISASEKTVTDCDEMLDDIHQVIEEVTKYNRKIKQLDDKIETLRAMNSRLSSSSKEEIEQLEAEIAKCSKTHKELKAEVEELKGYAVSFTYIAELLKDDGIKSKIIKTYLPIINKLVRKYLDILGFSVDFRFDEFFNETIKSRFRDNFSYANFSEGEKLRIDLCLLFTWRELSRMKNSSATNLIILDEIGDSSLDSEGFDSFMKILNVNRENQCSVIISHKPEGISNRVDTIVETVKTGNFSTISVTQNAGTNELT